MKKINFLFLLVGLILGFLIQRSTFHQKLKTLFVNRIEILFQESSIRDKKDNLGVNKWHDSKLTFSQYKFGVPMYLDEPYADSIGDRRLEGLKIIKIRRHQKANVRIESEVPLIIYRVTPKENHGLIHDYLKTDIKVLLNGYSSQHVNVLRKEFKPGSIVLAPGGPISASPILFSIEKNLEDKNIDIFSDLQYLP